MKKDPVRGRKAVTEHLQLVQAGVARLYFYENQLIQPIHRNHATSQDRVADQSYGT